MQIVIRDYRDLETGKPGGPQIGKRVPTLVIRLAEFSVEIKEFDGDFGDSGGSCDQDAEVSRQTNR